MAVEIYQEPELQEIVQDPEKSEEWKKLVAELGLEGQEKLVGDDSEGSPSVYLPMSNSMIHMFKVLCPMQTTYEKFSRGTIPVEVLKELLLCKHQKLFDKIKIWHDDIDPDPIAVGERKGEQSLIARWGDEILPFEELMIKAKKRLTDQISQQIKDFESSKEALITKYLSGQNVYASLKFESPTADIW